MQNRVIKFELAGSGLTVEFPAELIETVVTEEIAEKKFLDDLKI